MNKTPLKFAAVLAALLMAAAPASLAGGGCGHCGKGGGDLKSKFFHKAHYIMSNAEELGLSEEQVKDIENLKYDVKKDMIQRGADIEVLGIDIKRLLMDKNINVETVNKMIDQKYELKKEKSKALVAALAELKNSLSDEQYQKLKDMWSGKKTGYHGKDKKKD